MPTGEANAAKTHCPQGHPYDEHEYRTPSRPNARYCRLCKRLNERERKRKLRRAAGVPEKPGYSPAERRAAVQNAKARIRARSEALVVTAKEYLSLQCKPCFYCGGPGGTVDHVIPLSRGGRHSIGNMVPSCHPCNMRKGSFLLIEWVRRKGGY